ncbi:hypothetical protein AAW14_37780 [Streptomyces hygroscopicus]|uniref:hypothetical protein n=1 Tax=Streptomyces hygroscopicus TaxID=1912 RepID=UPI00223FF180|nr:hypothetical protein [Streptomyces hygroscopicus]MCW7947507.1 hypothetical protein [Streptomyces hygroscopicus]
MPTRMTPLKTPRPLAVAVVLTAVVGSTAVAQPVARADLPSACAQRPAPRCASAGTLKDSGARSASVGLGSGGADRYTGGMTAGNPVRCPG